MGKKKSSGLFLIILLIAGVWLYTNYTKKEGLPYLQGDFTVDIVTSERVDYASHTSDGHISGKVKVENKVTSDGSMYVEVGLYAIEDNPWLQQKFGTVISAPICVSGESHVVNKRVDLNGCLTSFGPCDDETFEFNLPIPSGSGGKNFVVFAEAFKQCASQGDPGVSDWDKREIGKLSSSNPGQADCVEDGGIVYKDSTNFFSGFAAIVGNTFAAIGGLEDEVCCSRKIPRREPYYDKQTSLITIFGGDAEAYVCPDTGGGFCWDPAAKYLGKYFGDNCTTATIALVAAIFLIFMFMAMAMK